MSSNRALKQLKRVWGKSGLDRIPSMQETKGNMREDKAMPRQKSTRTARLDLRLTSDEKKRTELLAVREGVSINEMYSRMLALYEREHGRVELAPAKDAHAQDG